MEDLIFEPLRAALQPPRARFARDPCEHLVGSMTWLVATLEQRPT